MKKNLFITGSILLLGLLLIPGCQKEIEEKITATSDNSEAELQSRGSHDRSNNNQCQFTHLIVEGFEHVYHYNSKGLADEWHIDYGDGVYHDVFTMEYDKNSRLIKAWYHYDGAWVATIDFVWKGKLITDEHWDYSGFIFDVINIYNKKDQMIKRELSYGHSAAIQFSPNGNTPKVDIFLNGELASRAEYTYYRPNKNPFLAIRGIPYGFPFVAMIFSQWWETSDKTTAYENGVPTVLWDYDPAETKIQFGFQNYPSLITYYDRISNSVFTYGFEFQNCGRGSNHNDHSRTANSHPLQSGKANTNVKKMALLKMGPPALIEKQIEDMKK
ncbi:MAG: hypothetical protein ACXWV6_08515 [Chitinophagaceae bacterium]